MESRQELANTSRPALIFIGGNPGCAELYRPFLEILYAALGGEVSIYCCPYHGHESFEPKKEGQAFERRSVNTSRGELEHQIRHQQTFVVNVCKGRRDAGIPNPDRCVFVGHSIGAYMCNELAVRFAARRHVLADTPQVVALLPVMPFIRLSFSDFKIGVIANLQSQLISLFSVSGFLFRRFLQNRMGSKLLEKMYGLSPFLADVLAQTVDMTWVHNYISLGLDEILTMPRQHWKTMQVLRVLARVVPRVSCLYTSDDQWAPLQDVPVYQHQFSAEGIDSIRFTVIEGLRHDFVACDEDVEAIVSWVVEQYHAIVAVNSLEQPLSPDDVYPLARL